MSNHTATASVDVRATPAEVWATLTEPDRIAQWMGGSRVETDWSVGGPITWSGEHEGRTYQDKGEVLEYDEPHRLSMTHYSASMGADDVPENYHTVTYTLDEAGEGTRVALTQDGCADEEQAEQFSASWQQMLEGLGSVAEGS
jgi:uncharacterized protein YndB with AHSA1/START domain